MSFQTQALPAQVSQLVGQPLVVAESVRADAGLPTAVPALGDVIQNEYRQFLSQSPKVVEDLRLARPKNPLWQVVRTEQKMGLHDLQVRLERNLELADIPSQDISLATRIKARMASHLMLPLVSGASVFLGSGSIKWGAAMIATGAFFSVLGLGGGSHRRALTDEGHDPLLPPYVERLLNFSLPYLVLACAAMPGVAAKVGINGMTLGLMLLCGGGSAFLHAQDSIDSTYSWLSRFFQRRSWKTNLKGLLKIKETLDERYAQGYFERHPEEMALFLERSIVPVFRDRQRVLNDQVEALKQEIQRVEQHISAERGSLKEKFGSLKDFEGGEAQLIADQTLLVRRLERTSERYQQASERTGARIGELNKLINTIRFKRALLDHLDFVNAVKGVVAVLEDKLIDTEADLKKQSEALRVSGQSAANHLTANVEIATLFRGEHL